MKTKTSLVMLAVLASGTLSSHADINAVLSQWNVITSGDLSQVTDIGGRAYLGGENNDIFGGVMAHSLNLNGEVNLPVGATSAAAWEGTLLPNVVVIPESSTAIPALGAVMVTAGFIFRRRFVLVAAL